MAPILRTALATAIAFVLAGTGLSAQEAPSFGGGIKARFGVDSGNVQKDTNANKMLGVGMSFTYSLAKGSTIIGELTYTQFSSVTFPNPVLAPANPALSGDMRRNKLSGFSARFGYRKAIGETEWSWQAGLLMDRLKSRQEVSGQLAVGATIGTAVIESLVATPESTKLRPGAFAGVYTNISPDISLEFNILTVGYSQVNWVPQTYSGQTAAAVSTNRTGLALECAFGFRF